MLPTFRSTRRAFTLIEMVVVIGVIGVLIGVGFAALRTSSPTTGLRIGQGQLVSMFTALRAQAALSGQTARLIIDATNTDPVNYLRRIRVVTQDPADATNWILLNEGVLLPEGVFFVPPGAGSPTLAEGGTWAASALRSNINSGNVATTFDVNDTPGLYHWVQITARGTPSSAPPPPPRIVLGAGQRVGALGTDYVGFLSSDLVRGIRWSQYGLTSVVNDMNGFQ